MSQVLSSYSQVVVDYLESIGVEFKAVYNEPQTCPPRRCEPMYGMFGRYGKIAHNHGKCFSASITRNNKTVNLPTWWSSLQDSYKVIVDNNNNSGGKSVVEKQKYEIKPTAYDILSSFMLDAYTNMSTFEEWSRDLGYSSDSISAKETYEECYKIAILLQRFFSKEELDHLQEICS